VEVRGETPFLDAEISGFLEPQTMNLEQGRLVQQPARGRKLDVEPTRIFSSL